jgi:thioredoxin-related protein
MQKTQNISVFLLLFAFLFNVFTCQAQEKASEEGIHFFHGTWEEVQKEAKEKKKMIFIDAFTEWCGPCKAMAANTFTDKTVGAYFNENFINYKYDMEKTDGPAFAARYGVTAYPSLFFINSKGNVIHKVVGYQKPEQLLDNGKLALDPRNNFAALKSEYEAGTQDPELLFNYAERLYEQKEDEGCQAAAKKYFATQTEADFVSERNWKAIKLFVNDLDSREFQLLLKLRKNFAKKFTEKAVEERISAICYANALYALDNQDDAVFEKAIECARKNLSDNGMSADKFEIKAAEAKQNWKLYAEKCAFYTSKYTITDAEELNQMSWTFFKNIDDTQLLTKALGWSKQSMAIANMYYNNDTYAALCFKLGKYEDATRYANKAIRLAQNENLEYGETEKLLELIQEKQGARQ